MAKISIHRTAKQIVLTVQDYSLFAGVPSPISSTPHLLD